MAEPAAAKPERSQEGEASGVSRTECRPPLDAGIPSEPGTHNQAGTRNQAKAQTLSGKHQDYLR
jgi:hypothetical protein